MKGSLFFLAVSGLHSLNAQPSFFNFTAELDSYTSSKSDYVSYPGDYVTENRGTIDALTGSVVIDQSTPDYASSDPEEGRYISGLYRTPAYTEPGNPENNLTDNFFTIEGEGVDAFSDSFQAQESLSSGSYVYYSPSVFVYNDTSRVFEVGGFEIPLGSDAIFLSAWEQSSGTRGYSNREFQILLVDEEGSALSSDALPETITLSDFEAATLSYEDINGRGTGTFALEEDERILTGQVTQFSAIPEPSTAALFLLSLAGLFLRRR